MRTLLPSIPFSGPIFLLFLASLSLFPLLLPAEEGKVIEKKAELAELKKKIAALQEVMQERQSKLQKEDAVLKDVDLRISDINSNLRDLDRRKQGLYTELSDLQAKKTETVAALQAEQQILAQQLRSAYVSGHEEYIKLIMNQQDPAVVSRMLVYYRYLTESRVRTINRINQHLDLVMTLESGIQTRSVELKNLINLQRERWRSLKLAYLEQKKAVQALRNELAGNLQQIERMQNDEQELLRLIEKLREIIDELLDEERTGTSFQELRGLLKLPVKADIVVRFGARRQIGNMRWKGIILAGELGSDIHAVYQGRVVFADWMRGFGLLLIIDHGDSYLSLYGYNESIIVEEGDWVATGQTVASMGKSGGSSKPGLYFGIRYKGRPQNPLRWARR
ncbi:MAG: peptidoglycan DD-metalloendopeptidase family protein [Gammaproteobacteria bacterium]|nr:MAG: peptidoglycan DD-metalloendopeptidase family protein [Gammaproteobacteria bacterium]